MIKGLDLTTLINHLHQQAITYTSKQGTGSSLLLMVTDYSTWHLNSWWSRMVLCNSVPHLLPHLLLPGQHALPAKNRPPQQQPTVDSQHASLRRQRGSSGYRPTLAQKGHGTTYQLMLQNS
jgi:hypothetical protein